MTLFSLLSYTYKVDYIFFLYIPEALAKGLSTTTRKQGISLFLTRSPLVSKEPSLTERVKQANHAGWDTSEFLRIVRFFHPSGHAKARLQKPLGAVLNRVTVLCTL